MLLYIYFITILSCISSSEEESLRSNRKQYKSDFRYERGRNRNREVYKTYDKDGLAHIDLASFILNPDGNSDHGQKTSQLSEKDYVDDNSIINIVPENEHQDYRSLESDLPEVNILTGKRVPHGKLSSIRSEQANTHIYRTDDVTGLDTSFVKNLRNNGHANKKCILKNMKIPFFSRDGTSTTKTKKNRKRKLFTFRNSKKNSTKMYGNVHTNNIKGMTKEPSNYKVIKRSYYERLCPVCRQKFMSSIDVNSVEKFRRTANDVMKNDDGTRDGVDREYAKDVHSLSLTHASNPDNGNDKR